MSDIRNETPVVKWKVDIPCNNYMVKKQCTWADIKGCANELGKSSGEVFACLHRFEGGFMCMSGPNFKSTEPAEGGTPLGIPIVRKAIRFQCHPSGMYWPSMHNSFAGAHDDDVVFKEMNDYNFVSLRFEGQNCKKWSKAEAKQHADTIAALLGWEYMHKNTSRSRLIRLNLLK